MTKEYYGTKRITAYPKSRIVDATSGLEAEGYEVIYQPDGYTSWSPKDVFEEAYQPIDAMSFGHAIKAMKDGHKVCRKGWNGKGMFLVLVGGSSVKLREGTPYHKALVNVTDISQDQEILPHIDMWTVNADGRRAMLPGWLASQTDMLSDDWMIVD
ncbi:MAG: DUF2829 domain-containing protein [Terasakiella sp.]|uniref:DUF2829 domain-containing protein n=1 Tax=unclassified Terasakiella TaxID=2614952 RepID=UPI003B00CD34